MRKNKIYSCARFNAETIQEALANKPTPSRLYTATRYQKETWSYDSAAEFFTSIYNQLDYYHIRSEWSNDDQIEVTFLEDHTDVTICNQSRAEIERLFGIFERNYEKCRIPVSNTSSLPVIFIGHGKSMQWRELKDHLQDKHCLQIEAYEIGARAGHVIRDILEEMLRNSSFALLVLTCDDEIKDGGYHPRLNVAHELGLFQGKLGFSRAIVLLEDGISEDDFSNISGIQQLRFSRGNIKETFGDILATLRREFPNSGVAVRIRQ